MPRKKKEELLSVEPIREESSEKKKKELPKCQYIDSIFGGKGIKMTFKPKVKHNCEYFAPGNLAMQIIGRAGSGKSTVLTQIIPCLKLSKIAYFSRIQGNSVADAIESYANDNKIKYYYAYEVQEAENIVSQMIEETKEGDDWGILIFDDFVEYTTSRNNKYQKFINLCNGMMRNYNFHSCFVTQSALMVSTLFRCNTNVKIVFDLKEQFAIQSIRRDFMENTGISREQFDKIFSYVQKYPHGFIMLSNDNNIYINLPNKTQGLELVDFRICCSF